MATKIVYCCFIVSCVLLGTRSMKYEDDNRAESLRLQQGKEKLSEIENTAEYSPCWSKALEALHVSCRSMSDDDQRRLALSFANCHFQSSHRSSYPCPSEKNIADCTSSSSMGDAAFQVYTEFFTHTSNICFFVQSQLWQEKTEGTINRLSDASVMAVDKLEESLDYHRKLEEKQNQAIKNQGDILDQDAKIAESLTNTRSNMNEAFQEMYTKAESQKLILDETLGTLKSGFGSIQWILSSILGEIITLETAGFFIITMVIITLLPQFGTSRLWLIATLLLYAVLEGLIKRLFLTFVNSTESNSMSQLHTCLWYNRWAACALLCAVFFWRYLAFTGRERKQETLLEGMSKKLEYIQQSLPCTPNRQHPHNPPFIDEETDSFSIPQPSSDAPMVVPLKDLYQSENHAGNIVSGTQLVDFLSGLYVNNIQSDVEVHTTTDNTYHPPPSVLSSTITEIESHEEEQLPELTRPTLASSRPRPHELDSSLLTNISDVHEGPLIPRSLSNESFTSTMSLNLERCAIPSSNRRGKNSAHLTNRGKASSVAREDPSNDAQYRVRESTPVNKTKRQRKQRKQFSHCNEDDDSGFSTDGSNMRQVTNCVGRRYNLRPRKRQATPIY